MFEENFEGVEGAVAQRRVNPAGAVQTPHDPEAQWCPKPQNNTAKEGVGYKVPVAETVEESEAQPGEPTRSFLTAVVRPPATGSDEAGLEQTLEEQTERGVDKPQVLFTDGSYLSGELLTKWEAEGREWIGPVQPPAKRGKFAFKSDAFEVNVEEQQALCPAGQQSTPGSRLEEKERGKVSYRFEWSWRCKSCALRSVCVPPDQKHRTLVVGEFHTALQRRRQEMKTEAFEQRKKHRNAIEGTHSERVREHGRRRAR